MKLPWWFMKVWNDPMGKGLILFVVIGGPLWSVLTYLIDPISDGWWQAWAFAWGFFILLIVIFYWQRNTK